MTAKKKYSHPPRFMQWLLKWVFPDRGAYSTLGDMAEAYQILYEERGAFRARLWYRYQFFKALPYFFSDVIYWRIVMFKNYMKIAIRHMRKQKGYSFINLSGLIIGMTCTILILLWVKNELSYDKFHEHKQDIYRVICVGEHNYFSSPAPFAPAIAAEVPEVMEAVRVIRAPRFVLKYGDNAFYEDNGITADPSFLSIFTFPLIKGDPETALNDPFNIVITENMAQRYFGEEDPLNKSLSIEGRGLLEISGVMADVPENSHFQFDYVLPHKFLETVRIYGLEWGDFNFMTYIMASENRNEEALISKLNSVAEKHGCHQVVMKQLTFSIQSMQDIYLNPLGNYDIPLGNKKYVYIFSAIAFFILFIACINFINLSTARSERRAKEVGLRKVVGASRMQVVRQFFGESVFLALISLAAALLLAKLMIPTFNELTGKNLYFDIFNLQSLLVFGAVTCLVGILAGIYPALYLSSFEPVNVLKSGGSFISFLKGRATSFRKRGAMRKILVITQFSISLILILSTIVVYHQLNFIKQKSWGLDDEQMLYIPFKENIASKYAVIKNELLQHPGITAVAAKDCVPTGLNNNTSGVSWEGKIQDQNNIYMETSRVGFDYFQTMGMDIVAGRGFSKDFPGDVGSAYVLNEEAIKKMGIDDPVGKTFALYGRRGPIVGIVKNTFYHSLRTELRPQVFYLFTNLQRQSFRGVVLIRIRGASPSLPEILAHVETVWESINSFAPFEYHFLNETIDAQYKGEQRLGRLFGYFAFLAIFISCLGLFGLASFVTEQRTKEIGIRKTLGASIGDIVVMLSKDFTKWVLAANVIAWPVAWYLMAKWLQNFAYRTSIAWWTFLTAGITALLIAWLTVIFQTYKSARANPVEALKYE